MLTLHHLVLEPSLGAVLALSRYGACREGFTPMSPPADQPMLRPSTTDWYTN
jgi:hypothetical protein